MINRIITAAKMQCNRSSRSWCLFVNKITRKAFRRSIFSAPQCYTLYYL